MKKLSFSLSSSNNSSKPSKSTSYSSQNQHDQSAKKEFVTEFDPSKTLADSTSKTPLIIPPIPNEWKPQNKTENTDPPFKSDDPNLEFEVEPNSTVEPFDPNIIKGLNLRCKKGSGSESSSLIDQLMLKNLKRDLERLPEDRGLEEFDDVSIEEFAPALLKGYGWYEGRGIGKNAKEDVKVVQYTKWNAKEGLGFIERVWMA
ncbi:G-patch domain-containing protein [Cynara cardunculus var. scolymus]|uniref:G-patch domain-containing protein n=1 Tax=Cynara cardunculus var. scolymus TaxID=59895 RepID=A0A118JS80_CYNCS|nr:G-patch domain-containing protein [Cynara cardunculus var. scolymus]